MRTPSIAACLLAALVATSAACASHPERTSRTGAAPRSDPAAAEASEQAGDERLAAGDLEGAEQAFRRAIAAAADEGFAYDGLAVVQLHRGDEAAAIATLQAGVAARPEIDPTYARTRMLENLAWLHMMAGRRAEAFRALDGSVTAQALDASARDVVTHVGRARLYLEHAELAAARAEVATARATAGAPEWAVAAARALEVRILASLGEQPRAAAMLAELTAQLGGDHPRLADARFAATLATGDLAGAATLLPALEAVDPFLAEAAMFELALAELAAGRREAGERHLREIATRYGRSAPSAHRRRLAEKRLAAATR